VRCNSELKIEDLDFDSYVESGERFPSSERLEGGFRCGDTSIDRTETAWLTRSPGAPTSVGWQGRLSPDVEVNVPDDRKGTRASENNPDSLAVPQQPYASRLPDTQFPVPPLQRECLPYSYTVVKREICHCEFVVF
jgi:hypothetical protein